MSDLDRDLAEFDKLLDAYDSSVRAQRESGFLPALAQRDAIDCVIHNRNRLRTHHAEIARDREDAARLAVVEDRLLTLVNAIKQAGGDIRRWSDWTASEREAIDNAMQETGR